MFYEEMQIKLLQWMRPHWSRVISFDMETHVPRPIQFLTNDRILSISFCRRVSGRLTHATGVEMKT